MVQLSYYKTLESLKIISIKKSQCFHFKIQLQSHISHTIFVVFFLFQIWKIFLFLYLQRGPRKRRKGKGIQRGEKRKKRKRRKKRTGGEKGKRGSKGERRTDSRKKRKENKYLFKINYILQYCIVKTWIQETNYRVSFKLCQFWHLRQNLKNLSRGLNLSRGSNMLGST